MQNRRTYLRRRIGVFGGLAIILGSGVYLPMTLLAPLEPATAQVVQYAPQEEAAPELAWPGTGASAIGAIGFPGTLASSGESTPRSIASITKVITSLVVLDEKPLEAGEHGPTITFDQRDAALYDKYFVQNGKVEPIRAGLQLSQRQTIEVVLVSSANNYAESLARWAFGSEPEFVVAATAWLERNGFTNTRLFDASGMNPANTSTPDELVQLGKLALAHPVVSAIVATPSLTLPHIGSVKNTNPLLGSGGVDGIKTGTLPEAGSCLLFSADIVVGESTVTVVGVVLGGQNRESLDAAARALLASAAAGFQELPLVTSGEVFASYSTPWDQHASAVATSDRSILVWRGTPVSATVRTDEVREAEAGAEVGVVSFRVGEQTVEVPLELDAELGDPGPWWRLGNPLLLIG